MLKNTILNSQLLKVLCQLGHTQTSVSVMPVFLFLQKAKSLTLPFSPAIQISILFYLEFSNVHPTLM